MKKLLIADTGEEFTAALQEALQGSCCIEICRDGAAALSLLETFRPDVMILDLLLPVIDGVTVLQRADSAGICPVTMVVTRYVSEYMMDVMERLNVGYVMLKPCAVDAVVQRLADLMQERKPAEETNQTAQALVEEMLHRLGFPTYPRGYACLREVLLEELRDPGQQVTKTLYPAVAKKCSGSTKQVERAIRCLIVKVWPHRDEAIWNELFPANRGDRAECPTNKAFIAAVSGKILAEYQKKDTYLRKIG